MEFFKVFEDFFNNSNAKFFRDEQKEVLNIFLKTTIIEINCK